MSGSSSVSRATVFVEGVGNDVCCPFVDQEDNLFYLLQESGEVIAIDPSGETERIHCTNGQPSGATFDEQGILYISDLAHGAVLAVHEAGNDQQEFVVGVYEDKPLKGPHSIVAGKNNLKVLYKLVITSRFSITSNCLSDTLKGIINSNMSLHSIRKCLNS